MPVKKKPAPKKPAAKKAAPKKPAVKAVPKKPAPKKPAAKVAATQPAPAPAKKSAGSSAIHEGLRAKGPNARIAAAMQAAALGRKAPAEVVDALVPLLDAEDAVRRAATDALATIGPAATRALRTRIGRGPLGARAATALTLVRADPDTLGAALPVLAELLTAGGASEQGLIAELLALAPALGHQASPLIQPLMQRLLRATAEVQRALLSMVRELGPTFADELQGYVQSRARELAGQAGATVIGLLDGFERPQDLPALGEATQSPDLEVRRAALGALARRRAAEAAPYLLRALQDPAREIPGLAVAALRNLDPSRLHPVVVAFLTRLRQEPPESRNAAVVAVAELGVAAFDEVGPLLLDALSDEVEAVRTRAAQGLHALATEARAALPRLRGQRKDRSAAVRAAVEAAISAIEAAPR